MKNRSIQRTETPDCYNRDQATLNKWLEEIHNGCRSTHKEKIHAQNNYEKLFINKFRTDGR